jgi:NAD(P)-dependent dehydrogenase (short-subunit alcohol dehydrogenase family)
VTGATRGIGRACALELVREGATVYVTGRTVHEGDSPFPGSLDSFAEEAAPLDGTAVPVVCDHRSDDEVEAVFERVQRECGRLDVLVNNAFLIPDELDPNAPFWETPVAAWDDMHQVGARSSYIATRLAAAQMVERRRGLIASISSPGARYYYIHPAYGAAKAALDRLVRDAAHHLEPFGVAVIALWPYYVITERMQMLDADEWELDLDGAETLRFTGRAIVALATDEKVIRRTGRSFTTRQLALAYGFRDDDGSLPLGAPEPEDHWDTRLPPPPVGSLGDK